MPKQNTDDNSKVKNTPNNSSPSSFLTSNSSFLTSPLSKTRYCMGLQCPKILWLDLHKSEEKDPSAVNQARFDEGTKVGDWASPLDTY